MTDLRNYLETLANGLEVDVEVISNIFAEVNRKELIAYYNKQYAAKFNDKDGLEIVELLDVEVKKFTEEDPEEDKLAYEEELKNAKRTSVNLNELPLSLLKKIRARFKGEIGVLNTLRNEKEIMENLGNIIKAKVLKIFDDYITVVAFNTYISIPRKALIPTDCPEIGEVMLFQIADVNKDQNKLKIFLSRNTTEVLSLIVKEYVPEIKRGLIDIRDIIRYPGIKAYVIVESQKVKNCSIQCVGVRGERSKAISKEMAGERIIFISTDCSIQKVVCSVFGNSYADDFIAIERDDSVDIFTSNERLFSSLSKGFQSRNVIEELFSKKVNFFDIENDVSSYGRMMEAIFEEEEIYKAFSQVSFSIQSLKQIKPSFLSVNMLLEHDGIETVVRCILSAFLGYRFVTREMVMRVIQNDLYIGDCIDNVKKITK